MKIQALLLTCGILWVLVHLWLLPLVRDHWLASALSGKMARAGVLVVLEKVRELAAVGLIALLSVGGIVWLGEWLGTVGVVWPKTLIDGLASIHQVTRTIADSYGSVLAWVGLVGAGIALWWAAHLARRRVAAVWAERASALYGEMIADPSLLARMRDDPALRSLLDEVDAAVAETERSGWGRSEEMAASAQVRLGEALSNLAIAAAGAEVDFPAAAGVPLASEASEPRSKWQRVFKVLSSKRLGSDLGMIRKPMGRLVTFLLFVSLVGWVAEPMADSLRLAVNNLRVQLAGEAAQRDLNAALSRHLEGAVEEPDHGSSAADSVDATARVLARAVVRHWGRSPMVGDMVAVSRRTEAAPIRNALAGRSHTPSELHPPATRARIEAAVAVVDGDPVVRREVLTHIEAEVRPVLSEMERRSPSRFAAFVRQVEARYAAPMEPLDAQGRLTARIIDEAFSPLDVRPDSELGRQAQRLSKDLGKEAVRTWADTALKQFLTDTLRGIARPEVRNALALEATNEVKDLLRSMRAMEGVGLEHSPVASREARIGAKVAERVAALHGGRPASEVDSVTTRLRGYEASFPWDVALSSAGSSPDASRSVAPPAARGRTGHAVSTSFQLASRSCRTRGVLVGRDVGGERLDVTDLRWALSTSKSGTHRVRLELRLVQSGRLLPEWVEAGTFDAGVLNQALRYAADERVVATTILPGDGKAISRTIQLHPALVDSPLGCRIVAIDRVVDTFTDSPQWSSAALAALREDRMQMWQWLQWVGVSERLVRTGEQCRVNELAAALDSPGFPSIRFSEVLQAQLERYLAGGAQGADPRFDLVRRATACMVGSAAARAQCLCEGLARMPLAEPYWMPVDHTSQVRERAWKVASDLSWLAPSPTRLDHLDFWVHTTFALREPAGLEGDEPETAALDFPAVHLNMLRKEVAARLQPYFAQQRVGTDYENVMRPIEEFVLVQRLARAALDGYLGSDFPLQKLLLLERETAGWVAVQTTERWESADRSYAGILALRDLMVEADPDAGELYVRYLEELSNRIEAGRPMCDAASN